jgi:hypothetical protein
MLRFDCTTLTPHGLFGGKKLQPSIRFEATHNSRRSRQDYPAELAVTNAIRANDIRSVNEEELPAEARSRQAFAKLDGCERGEIDSYNRQKQCSQKRRRTATVPGRDVRHQR